MASWKHRLHEIVFEADTPSGKAFDITLLIAIVMSVATVMLESVAEIQTNYGPLLITLEWFEADTPSGKAFDITACSSPSS